MSYIVSVLFSERGPKVTYLKTHWIFQLYFDLYDWFFTTDKAELTGDTQNKNVEQYYFELSALTEIQNLAFDRIVKTMIWTRFSSDFDFQRKHLVEKNFRSISIRLISLACPVKQL